MKYRIVQILSEIPYEERIKITGELKEQFGLSTVQFSRRIRVKVGDTLDFRGSDLPVIAKLLNVKIEDLFTKVAVNN